MKIYQYMVPAGLFVFATVIAQLGTTAFEDVMEISGVLIAMGVLTSFTRTKRSARSLRNLH
jgi:hypothetical protein